MSSARWDKFSDGYCFYVDGDFKGNLYMPKNSIKHYRFIFGYSTTWMKTRWNTLYEAKRDLEEAFGVARHG